MPKGIALVVLAIIIVCLIVGLWLFLRTPADSAPGGPGGISAVDEAACAPQAILPFA
jgi:hypothetical protein